MAIATKNLQYSVTTAAIFVAQSQGAQPWTIGNAGGSNIFVGAFRLSADATLTGTEAQIKALATTRGMIAPFSRMIIPADITSVGLVTGTGYTSIALVQAGEQDAPEPAYLQIAVNAAMNGTRDLVAAPGALEQIWVYGLIGTCQAGGTVLLLDDTPGSHSGVMPVGALGGILLPDAPANRPWIKCAKNKKLQATLAATNDFDGILKYAVVTV